MPSEIEIRWEAQYIELDQSKIYSLIRKGANINYQDCDGWTLAHHAVKCENIKVLEILADARANFNCQTVDTKSSPLFFAKKWEIIKLLVRNNATLSLKNKDQQSIVSALLSNKSWMDFSCNSPNYMNDLLKLKLTCIVNRDQMSIEDFNDILELIKTGGASVNTIGLDGHTALHLAAQYKQEWVLLLIACGANVNALSNPYCSSSSPLEYTNDWEIIKTLVNNNASLSFRHIERWHKLKTLTPENATYLLTKLNQTDTPKQSTAFVALKKAGGGLKKQQIKYSLPNYGLSTDYGYNSGYESEETECEPEFELGSGGSDIARRFIDKKNGKILAVLNPLPEYKVGIIDLNQIYSKYAFFLALYPNEKIILFIESHKQYRLIVPIPPGTLYCDIEPKTLKTLDQQVKLFQSATLALEKAHLAGIVVIDLKEDNIFYDDNSGQSFLIDGGLSVKINQPILQKDFRCQDNSQLKHYIQYRHLWISRDVWHLEGNPPPLATYAMDIYSLGRMMQNTLPKPLNAGIKRLIICCLNQQISLATLKDELAKLSSILLEAKEEKGKNKTIPLHARSYLTLPSAPQQDRQKTLFYDQKQFIFHLLIINDRTELQNILQNQYEMDQKNIPEILGSLQKIPEITDFKLFANYSTLLQQVKTFKQEKEEYKNNPTDNQLSNEIEKISIKHPLKKTITDNSSFNNQFLRSSLCFYNSKNSEGKEKKTVSPNLK